MERAPLRTQAASSYAASASEYADAVFRTREADMARCRIREVKRVLAEDNLVAVHCLQRWPNNDDYAAIDIFRLDDDGKIVEHWDVLQVIPESSANPNGMF